MKKVLSSSLFGVLCAFSNLTYAGAPGGWTTSGEHYEFGIDNKVFYSKPRSFYIKSLPGLTDNEQGELYQSILSTKYSGKRLRISAYLKINNPIGSNSNDRAAGLWVTLHKDGERVGYGFASFGKRDGRSVDWSKVEVVLDVPTDADSIAYGFRIVNGSKADLWIDDISFEIVGTNIPIKGVISSEPVNLP